MARHESEFKKWFRNNTPYWVESYEPRRGGGVGIPDIQIGVEGVLIPIELKVGRVDENHICWTEEVRADQIGWHRCAAEAMIPTLMCVGIAMPKNQWQMIWVDGIDMRLWKAGYEINSRVAKVCNDWKKLPQTIIKPAMHRRLLGKQ